jgi:hypothetical protein
MAAKTALAISWADGATCSCTQTALVNVADRNDRHHQPHVVTGAGDRDLAGLHRIEHLEAGVHEHLLGDLQGDDRGQVRLDRGGEGIHPRAPCE